MELALKNQPTVSLLSNVERVYLEHQQTFEQRREVIALRHRRRLVRKRAIFQKRLDKALSPQLQAELNVRVVLDTKYLSVPGFIGLFDYEGQRWILGYQRSLCQGRWFFRALRTTKLYSCTQRTLEPQLCYALGQCRQF